MLLKPLLPFFFFCCAVHVYAQHHFVQYNDKNGLPSNLVYFVYQDKKGFIWIATDEGVCRFDGSEFKYYNTPDGLGSNEVFRIAEDTSGKLFFYTSDNALSYYEKGRIQNASVLGFKGKLLISTFSSFFFSSDNVLCANFGFSQYQYPFTGSGVDTVYSLTRPQEEYSYKTRSGTKTIAASALAFLKKELADEGISYENIFTKPFRLAFSGDTLLLVTKRFVSLYKISGKQIFKIKRIDFTAEANAVDLIKPGILSVTSFNKGTQIISLNNELSRQQFNPAGFTTHSLVDREGNYWLATYNSGLFLCLNPGVKVIGLNSGLADEKVVSMCRFGDFIFAGHPLGKISYISLNGGRHNKADSINLPVQRPEFNVISGFEQLNKNELLVATNNGFALIKKGSGSPSAWHKTFFLSEVGSIKDLFVSADTVFAISTRNLIVMGAYGNKRLSGFFYDSLRITAVEKNRDGQVLLGTMSGLYINHSRREGSIRRLFADSIKAVVSIAARNNLTAIGTDNDGVFIQVATGGRHLKYPEIVSNNINRVVWDDSSGLWICTAKGMNYVQPDGSGEIKEIKTYNLSSGLPSEYITDAVRIGDTCYAGTNRGIAVFPLSSAIATGAPELIKDDTINSYIIPYGKKASFQFAGISFKSLGQVTYKFRLKGYDTVWALSKEGNRELELLPPGDYKLEVKAVDRFGNESKSMIIPVEVLPLWYQLWWVRTLGIVMLLGFVFFVVRGYYRVRLSFQKKEFEKQMAVKDERQRISSELHDDISAGLSGVRLQAELLKNKQTNNDLQKDLQRIHSSVSDLSIKIRDVIWSLNGENDKIENTLYYIEQQSRKMFEFSNTNITTGLPAEIPDIFISGEKRRNLYLLIKEALHNIIKHAEASHAILDMKIQNSTLEIVIKDNGKGYNNNAFHQGMGIKTMQQRIKKLKGHIDVSHSNGTSLTISVPLENSNQ
jgi:signal transduction histidine kinase